MRNLSAQKLTALVLAVIMILTLIPSDRISSYAAGTDTAGQTAASADASQEDAAESGVSDDAAQEDAADSETEDAAASSSETADTDAQTGAAAEQTTEDDAAAETAAEETVSEEETAAEEGAQDGDEEEGTASAEASADAQAAAETSTNASGMDAADDSADASGDAASASERTSDDAAAQLLVKGALRGEDEAVSAYDDISLLSFDTEEAAEEAYAYYVQNAEAVSYNEIVYCISDDTLSAEEIDADAAEEIGDAIEILSEAEIEEVSSKTPVIALIDTGVSEDCDVTGAVSVIGDDPYDKNGHGTRMYEAITGVNEDAQILSIKAFAYNGKADAASVCAGIKYAIEAGADIINLSFSAEAAEENSIVADVIQEACDAGILVVGAAGNDGEDASDKIPGGIEDAYVFGSLAETEDPEDNAEILLNYNSNYGGTVDGYLFAGSTSEAAALASAYFSLDYTLEQMFKEQVAYESYDGVAEGEATGNEDWLDAINETLFGVADETDGDTDALAGKSVYLTKGSMTYYAGWSTRYKYVSYGSDTYSAYCLQPSKSNPAEGTYTAHTATGTYSYGTYEDEIKALMLLREVDTLWDSYGEDIFSAFMSSTGGNQYACLHAVISYLYCGSTTGLSTSQVKLITKSGGILDQVQALLDEDNEDGGLLRTYMAQATAYIIRIDGYQDIGFLLFPDEGGFKVIKTAEDEVTLELEGYSLKGAVYTVYTDESCADEYIAYDTSGEAAVLTTGKYGSTSKITLPSGTYYVKETTPSEGYELDETIYTAEVTSEDEITDVESEEPNPYGYVNVLKYANDESSEVVDGCVYTLYTDDSCDDDAVATDKNGDEVTFVIGESGVTGKATSHTVAVGTYYLKETSLSDDAIAAGYSLNTTVYTIVVEEDLCTWPTEDDPDGGGVTSESKGTVPTDSDGVKIHVNNEAPGCLTVVKESDDEDTDGNDNYDMTGAIFGVYTTKKKANAAYSQHEEDEDDYGTYVALLKTGSDGTVEYVKYYGDDEWTQASYASVAIGVYYVREMDAPASGYGLNTSNHKITVKASNGEDNAASVTISEPVEKVRIRVRKASENALGEASLKGAVYAIYTSESDAAEENSSYIDTVTVKDADDDGYFYSGYSSPLLYGTYYITEITAPTSGKYELSETVYTVTFSDGGGTYSVTNNGEESTDLTYDGLYTDSDGNEVENRYAFTVGPVDDSQTYGYLDLEKASSNTSVTDGNVLYSLAGAVFTVYTDEACTEEATDIYGNAAAFTVDENGGADALTMWPGTYYVKETSAPAGYSYYSNGTVYEVTVSANQTAWVNGSASVPEDPVTGTFTLQKYDADRGSDSTEAQGGATLEGAQYTVKYYDAQYSSASSVSSSFLMNTWVFETDENGKIDFSDSSYYVSGDDLYYDEDGNIVYPLGTYIITETEPSTGYVADEEAHIVNITSQYSGGSVCAVVSVDGTSSSVITVYSPETVIRGGIIVYKYDQNREYDGDSDNASTPQGDATLEGAQFTIYNSSEESVYVDSSYVETVSSSYGWTIKLVADDDGDGWYEDGEDIFVLTTDENGYASLDGNGDGVCKTLPYGTYTVTETKAPTGYLIGDGSGLSFTRTVYAHGAVYEAGYTNSLTSHTGYFDYVKRGGITVYKYDQNREYDGDSDNASTPQGDATLKGAEFTIYNSSTESVYVTSDYVESVTAGDWTIELKADNNNDGWYEAGEDIFVLTTDENGYASLDGNGDGVCKTLPYGTYTVTETKAPTGYLIGDGSGLSFTRTVYAHGAVYEAGYTNSSTTHTGYFDYVKRGGITVYKYDSETGLNEEQGGADFVGTVLEIVNSSTEAVYVPESAVEESDYIIYDPEEAGQTENYSGDKAAEYSEDGWFLPGEVIMYIIVQETDDGIYATTDGNLDGECYTLPYGTYTVTEIDTAAEKGYYMGTDETNSSDLVTTAVLNDGTDGTGTFCDGQIVVCGQDHDNDGIYDKVLRGEIAVIKQNDDGEPLENILFRIDSVDKNGEIQESHYFVTDSNGYFTTSWSYTSHLTAEANGNDEIGEAIEEIINSEGYDSENEELAALEAQLSSACNIWFSEDAEVNTGEGCLPFGTYIITEIRTSANWTSENNYYELLSWTVDINQADGTHGDGTYDVYETGNVNDEENGIDYAVKPEYDDVITYTRINTPPPESMLDTQAAAVVDNNESQFASATDGVYLKDTLSFTDIDDDDYYKVVVTLMDSETKKAYTDQSGNTYSKTIYIQDESGSFTKTVKFTDVDLTGAEGKELVFFAYVYDMNDDGSEYNSLTNWYDRDETIYVAEITTEALDSETGLHVADSKDSITVTDTVSYSNLPYSSGYTLVGILYNADTGEPLLDGDGNDIVARTDFKTNAAGGATLTYDDDYDALVVSGTASLTFTVDTEDLDGATIVACEYLYSKLTSYQSKSEYQTLAELIVENGADSVSDIVAYEEDLTNEDQTIHIPAMSTAASDTATLDNVGVAATETGITDTVSYENVVTGYTYKLEATVVDYSSGEAAEYTGETEFTPARSSGTASVTIDGINAEQDDTYVVYMILYVLGTDDEWHFVCNHEYIDDESETIHYPDVQTKAFDINTGDDVGTVESSATVVDTVLFSNVVPGMEYTVTGSLIDQETGETLSIDGATFTSTTTFTVNASYACACGETFDSYDDAQAHLLEYYTEDEISALTEESDHYITDETTITVSDGESGAVTSVDDDGSAASGTVTVTFTGVDSETLSGGSVVVYEVLSHNEIEVASHEEPLDEDQTVHYPDIDTEAYDYYTGDHTGTVWGRLINGIRSLLGFEDADADGIADAVQNNLIDSVSLENLVPGRTYTLTGTLYDYETDEAYEQDGGKVTATATFTVSEDGTKLTLESGSADSLTVDEYDETYNSVDATVKLAFSIDTSQTEGMTVVVYESLYHNDTEVVSHTDIDDEDQTVFYPQMQTHAADSETLDHAGTSSETATIIDEVKLTNLTVGKEYTVTGYPVYQEDYTDSDGVYHEADTAVEYDKDASTDTVTFTATATEMTVTLTYVIDSTLLEGTTAVVYEDLYYSGVLINSHHDIYSEEQSVYYPQIHTSAADGATADDVGAYTEEGSIIDTVSFTNLRAGMTYTVKGVLYSQETGTVLYVDGEEVTAETTLTINEDGTASCSDGETIGITSFDSNNGTADGTVTVTFAGIDTTALSDTTVVVYERLYHTHEDCADCWMTQTDDDAEEVLVADHTELLDKEQSVHYPQIHTTAVDSETGTHAGSIWGVLVNGVRTLLGYTDADGNGIDDSVQQSIVDTVELNNLVPGRIYTVTGVLYDQATEEPLTINGEEITQSATFKVAEDGSGMELTSGEAENLIVTEYDADKNLVNGTIDLVFPFDSSLLDNEPATIVVFEDLYHNAVLVAVHEDIGDESQSVNEISVSSSAVDADTGDKVGKVSGQSSGAADNASDESSGDDSDDTSSGAVSSIIDTVSMEKLVYGEEYTVVGYLIDQSESTTDNLVYLTNADGTEITSSVTFTANGEDENFTLADSDEFSASGSVTLTFTFENELVQGKAITVVTEIYTENVLIAVHGYSLDEDGNFVIDADESVYYPTGKTNATDADTEAHTSDSDTDTIITDLVYFQNLLAGEEYTITGTLYYQEDFTDANGVTHSAGDPVTTDHSWEAETVDLGTSYVCVCGETFSSSDDAEAHLLEYYTEDDISSLTEESDHDIAVISGATALYTCSVCGETSETAYEGGCAYTSSVTFTATSEIENAQDVVVTTLADGTQAVSGYIPITFTVDTSALAGATIVTFEKFSHNGVTVFVHADLEDTPQMIKIPAISTNAHVEDLDEADVYNKDGSYATVTITDTVSYENLWTTTLLEEMREDGLTISAGDTTIEDLRDGAVYNIEEKAVYTLKATLMVKETEEPLTDSSGNVITVTKTFTAENEDDTVDVEFTLDLNDFLDEDGSCTLEGAALVAYEVLYCGDSADDEDEIGSHEDIGDEAQTIYFSEKGSTTPDTDTSTPQADSSAPETDSSVSETDSSVPEADSSTPETDSSTPEADSSAPETASSTSETDSSTSEPDSSAPVTDTSAPETGDLGLMDLFLWIAGISAVTALSEIAVMQYRGRKKRRGTGRRR